MPRFALRKRDLYREAVRATWLGLAVNVALGIAKLAGGLVAQSFVLISDAVNSLGDVFTSLAVLLALRVAQKPADAEHPYGHTRAEAIAGSNVAVLVLVSALLVGWEALRVRPGHAELPPLWALAIAAANVAIKEGLYQYKSRVGRRSGSSAVIANAWDHRADALSALAVLLGLAAIRIGGPRFLILDTISALFVVSVIVTTAARLLWASAQELMDAQADPSLVAKVRAAAEGVDGVRRVDKLRARKSGLEYLVDIHIQVDATLTVHEGHRISHLVKDRLLEGFGSLRDVLVHLEPYPHPHEAEHRDSGET
ncbi:putative cation efflux system protein [Aquisphaera giovannonii]|uniref:Putative cation efflux system protein n=1 Tax=Aquisphaera giovannonii TaxID=406548 RepID=A0A5B9VX33_9BACT|nr:cation diffusion facilitator family transporter [Aquisphaera giovannonii]QEH32822.1 putative cation efflux system protein [Aquisphaera giovannonii]